MYIVIGGGGVAGAAIAADLVNRKHDVVVIDLDRKACEDLYAMTGAITVNGKATEIGSLKEAGIAKADVAIGALYRDVDNLTFALLAHSFGVSKIIVKMRDPAYEEAYKIAGVTEICDMIGMIRTRVLTEIEASEIKIIAPLLHGKTQLAMFQVPASWPVEGILVQNMARKKVFSGDCVFAGILNEKSEKIVVPHGQDRVYPGDRIFIVSGAKTLKKISKLLVDEKKASQKGQTGRIKSMRPPI